MNHTTLATPAGPLTILEHDGAVRAAGFTDDIGHLLTVLPPTTRAALTSREPRPRRDLGPITDAVRSYLDGDPAALDAVPVAQPTDAPFLARAWQVLRGVKPGAPISYREFATLAGRPRAVRAAASACARNTAALFVPCHRVLRSDGSLGGYRWGLPVKRWLIGYERHLTEIDS